jgi:hypothetical protein
VSGVNARRSSRCLLATTRACCGLTQVGWNSSGMLACAAAAWRAGRHAHRRRSLRRRPCRLPAAAQRPAHAQTKKHIASKRLSKRTRFGTSATRTNTSAGACASQAARSAHQHAIVNHCLQPRCRRPRPRRRTSIDALVARRRRGMMNACARAGAAGRSHSHTILLACMHAAARHGGAARCDASFTAKQRSSRTKALALLLKSNISGVLHDAQCVRRPFGSAP